MSNRCRNLCLRYPKAPRNSYRAGLDYTRPSIYYDLELKRCLLCDYAYYPEDWSKFRNPACCTCCGTKMRSKPAHKTKMEHAAY